VSKSYVGKIAETMHRLLWENIIEEWLSKLMIQVPVLGWPVIRDVVLFLVDRWLVEPMFLIASRWGVFTSIDWKNNEIYDSYRQEAVKLIGAQDQDVWPEPDRKAFKDAARKLVRFNIRSAT